MDTEYTAFAFGVCALALLALPWERARIRRVGGLLFWRLWRIGGSVYITRREG